MLRLTRVRSGAVLLAALSTAAVAGHQRRDSSRPPRLFKDAREMLAIARAQGRREVTLLVAAVSGRAPDVAQRADAVRATHLSRQRERRGPPGPSA
jgi:hypothetical protein